MSFQWQSFGAMLGLSVFLFVPSCGGGDDDSPGTAAQSGKAGGSGKGGGTKGGTGGSAGADDGLAGVGAATGTGAGGTSKGGKSGTGGSGAASGEGANAGDGNGGNGGSAGKAGGKAGRGGSAGTAGAGELAVFCGNGVVDGDEECERRVGCTAGERCSATCTCVAGPEYTPSSQALIEAALAAGNIDYPTSLLYRLWALYQGPDLPEAFDGGGSSGEDTYLFLELSRVLGSLPPDVEAAMQPYLVRPNDPASIFSQPTTQAKRASSLSLQDAPAAPTVGCDLNDIGSPDWRAYGTTNFVVWSCGGGVNGTDSLANARVVAGTLAEEVLAEMVKKLPGILPDDYAAGPAPQTRTDIYLLTPNQCRLRNGFCTPIPPKTLAAAAPTKPCGAGTGGAITSSAYLVIGASSLPSTAPAPGAKSELRYILAHEFFHAISFRLNFEAQGGSCRERTDPDLPVDELRSWLTEASAEWASFAFFKDDAPERRTRLFELYEEQRDLTQNGLPATTDSLPYQAFLYPLFIQEENGAKPDLVLDFWTGSGSARNRVDLDNRLNTLFSFADHFRDFSVRNFNRDLPGTPIPEFHGTYDDAIPVENPHSFVPEPSPELPSPLEFPQAIQIAPLAEETLHYYFTDDVRWVSLDASSVSNVGHLSLDVLYKVNDEWKRERVNGAKYVFCRDEEAKDASEVYLVLSNFDRDRAGAMAGDVKVTTRQFCPGGWSGIMRVRQIFDSTSRESDAFHETVEAKHEVETHEWEVLDSQPAPPINSPGAPDIDRARMLFRGEMSGSNESITTDEDCTSTYLRTESGSGSYEEYWEFTPQPGGTFSWGPETIGDGFVAQAFSTSTNCQGTVTSSENPQHGEMVAYLGIAPGLGVPSENPNDPGHYTGSDNPIHQVQTDTGGETVLDVFVEWDLRRTLTK